MATIKHISSKNADYGAAEAYLTFEHDEFTMKPTLDEAGRLIPRQDYRLDTLNCGEEDFALSCIWTNLRYGKNSKREDIKSHHYIISFSPVACCPEMAASKAASTSSGLAKPCSERKFMVFAICLRLKVFAQRS